MSRPSVVVADYGFGNVRSACRALERAGASVELTADVAAMQRADGLVVPGVGAFAACMAGIRERGVDAVVRERLGREAPVLGICVGMQVLFSRGDEHGVVTDGICVLAGDVTKLVAPVLPHMGWNTVDAPAASVLFAGVEDQRFYFVHSYAARETDAAVVTLSDHGGPFIAAVESGVLAGTQFHPEKSGDAGIALLTNWLESLA
ncbi:MAG: imidazole glycerol-phosphate synthase subunit HisH [Frankiaceae bacterium]|nr:imidazole glycerol-phosphate synthase subunit HisH [Frankiaceae bacterium]